MVDPFSNRAELDEHCAKLLADVREVGWHIVTIEEDEEGPGYSFTVGLFYSYAHPEIVITGLSPETQQGMLNVIGEAIKSGTRYGVGQTYDDIVEPPYECEFISVPKGQFPDYLGFDCWFYRGTEFPVIQCLWPSRTNQLPTRANYTETMQQRQPVLAWSA